jgi:hypothetical protein
MPLRAVLERGGDVITCEVCGEPIRANQGGIYPVFDVVVALCKKECRTVYRSRLLRLLPSISREFRAERRLMFGRRRRGEPCEKGERSET